MTRGLITPGLHNALRHPDCALTPFRIPSCGSFFSGCGNTLNCNQPVVRQFILDCLRYWVTEYHVDGFR